MDESGSNFGEWNKPDLCVYACIYIYVQYDSINIKL